MARRTQILDNFVAHLAANTDVLEQNIVKRYAYLHEVNDFPAVCMMPQSELRIHRGADARQGIMNLFVRAYVYDGDDVMGACDTLGASLETAIHSFAAAQRALEVEETRVTAFRTDEGLFQPYGMVDLEVQILYEVSDDIK